MTFKQSTTLNPNQFIKSYITSPNKEDKPVQTNHNFLFCLVHRFQRFWRFLKLILKFNLQRSCFKSKLSLKLLKLSLWQFDDNFDKFRTFFNFDHLYVTVYSMSIAKSAGRDSDYSKIAHFINRKKHAELRLRETKI